MEQMMTNAINIAKKGPLSKLTHDRVAVRRMPAKPPGRLAYPAIGPWPRGRASERRLLRHCSRFR
jgi:hypothetical protein